jgi:serine/threonine protein phosphatase 1
VHGRADLLDQVLSRIDADLGAHPASYVIQLFLGDYIDRGSASRDVLDRLIARGRTHRTIFLKGNHETYMVNFLKDPTVVDDWARYGGMTTLMSYGLTPSLNANQGEQIRLAAALDQALPDDHRMFLSSLPLSFSCGDYFFVHAGVRPGIPLGQQRKEDLLWIRDDFLLHEESFSKIVIHGHTPVSQPDVRPNRINIDTGAYATGKLTCLMIEADQMFFV